MEIYEKITEIKSFSDSFDYKNFLKTKDIFIVVRPFNLKFLEKENKKNDNIFLEKKENFNKNLQKFRKRFIEIVHIIYPEKEAIFLA